MTDRVPTDDWIEAANCLSTVAHQLSSAMHEANNLLQVIAGSAEMIQLNPGLPEDVTRRTAIIADHAHRVSSLLGVVRDLSKFAQGQPGDTTDLLAVVHAALDMRKHSLSRRQVDVAIEAGDDAVLARVGWRPAMQVVLNLLLNAEQAVVGRVGPRVVIRLDREDDVAVLTIADNGAGMPGDSDRFSLRLNQDAPPRLGMGLMAAEQVARRHSGRLEWSSSPEGVSATLRLPAVD
jgi:two-component system C4-dicarboxylate transport sensor histidine kinase DctB